MVIISRTNKTVVEIDETKKLGEKKERARNQFTWRDQQEDEETVNGEQIDATLRRFTKESEENLARQ